MLHVVKLTRVKFTACTGCRQRPEKIGGMMKLYYLNLRQDGRINSFN